MGSGPAPWRKHILAHQRPFRAVLFSPLGAGLFEPTLENEGSISGSDSTFYRQSEGEVTLRTATGKWEGWKGCGVYRQMGHRRAGEAVGLISCDHNHVVIDQRELRNWKIIVKSGTNASRVKLLLQFTNVFILDQHPHQRIIPWHLKPFWGLVIIPITHMRS